jgi:hypothetical protein
MVMGGNFWMVIDTPRGQLKIKTALFGYCLARWVVVSRMGCDSR